MFLLCAAQTLTTTASSSARMETATRSLYHIEVIEVIHSSTGFKARQGN